MKDIQVIVDMLLSDDEETFILGLTLLMKLDVKEYSSEYSTPKDLQFFVNDLSTYYDIKYNLNIGDHPNWEVIKTLPINGKFSKYLFSRTILGTGVLDSRRIVKNVSFD